MGVVGAAAQMLRPFCIRYPNRLRGSSHFYEGNAPFTFGSHGHLADVFCANLGCSKQAEKRGSLRSSFDCRASFGFPALHKAHDSDDFHSSFPCGLDRSNRRASRGAYVIDNQHLGALLAVALYPFSRSMGLLRFAHQKAMDQRSTVVLERVAGAGRGDVGDDRIGAHCQSSDRVGLQAVMVEQVQNSEPGQAAALGVQSGGAAVDVVIALGAGGEGKFPQLKGDSGKQ